ncbi:MAG TPA: HAMP domain-containing sensor histidine kinase [Candidatus Paceibacterota bacterium]|nr:HAMP domain-containing sensor histidine kinase [Candidatus Paceibacterota bacterium]HRZ34422.1 HAMP domain-containing sensor histidine kinase [Candidatus Paceibacterota bacterium]
MSYDSSLTMFAWSTLELIEVSFFFVSTGLVYVFFFAKRLPKWLNLVFILPIVPVFYYTITGQILQNYNAIVCEASENSNIINQVVLFTDLFYILSIIILYVWSVIKNKRQEILKNTLFFAGLLLFLVLYLISLYGADYLENYNWSLIALAGLPVFLGVVGFIAVRFNAFKFKILGSQILVFLSIFIVGSQFVFITNNINRILNIVTLVILLIGGILLIRSVRKVDDQKEQLALANTEQENLIHFISHQVKGFFTKSRNIFATMKDESDYVPENLRAFVDEGLRSDSEGIKVVTDILSAANLKTGNIQFSKDRLYINMLIGNIIDHNKSLADKKGVALKYNAPNKMIEFIGDEDRLKDAIGNIINNSVNYTMSGEIVVTLTDSPKQVKIVIKDTGVGLSEKDKARLFSSGIRGEDSLKYNVNSTGYGLYIAKRVIEGHGGTITAESEGRDRGSTFTIILPK